MTLFHIKNIYTVIPFCVHTSADQGRYLKMRKGENYKCFIIFKIIMHPGIFVT
jgi:hypothetical protein